MAECCAPTLAEARARIAAVRPEAYARSRNALDGAVSGLSPYLSHGLVSLPEVLAGVCARHALTVQHKFVFELGWREYWRHVWQHRGDGILRSLHAGPLPESAYARTLPQDVRQACTGVPVVDQAVRTLYATGLLHNHARMWLASWLVHMRKVHWRVGADWLYGHLLDGDLASNHLSWQWVAGTGSHKPYLFNADNVARYAPAAWHSPGTLIDTSYEALDRIARQLLPVSADSASHAPADLFPTDEPPLLARPPDALASQPPDAAAVQGREVWLVHPWQLGELPPGLPDHTQVIGLWVADFHRAWPWTARRWRFVGQRMAELCASIWYADAEAIGQALRGARRVRCIADPHLSPWLARWADTLPVPTLFAPVTPRCDAFSRWWTRVSRGHDSAASLLARATPDAQRQQLAGPPPLPPAS